MENASKALIIAGAILLSIVLITLGVVIIGQGQDTVNKSNIDDQAIATWNQKFTQYEGESVSGSNVNTLINMVLSSNATANKAGEAEKVIRIQAYDLDASAADSSANKIAITTGYKFYAPDATSPDSNTHGAKQCTKYAKSSIKYTVRMKYNGLGYLSTIYIKANS